MSNLQSLVSQCQSQVLEIKTISAVLQTKDQFLDSPSVLEIKEQLKTCSKEDKISLGKELNLYKQTITKICDEQIAIVQAENEKDDFVQYDPSFFAPKYKSQNGSLHPISIVLGEILNIFETMGFAVSDGPFVETQQNCFTSLNMPDFHPARSMQDTFYLAQKDNIGENYVMRTHTTGVDIRYTQQHKPPIAMVCPGQVFRNEKIDSTHDIMFHQIECLYIAERVSFSHLKTLIEHFYKQFFNDDTLVSRFRPSYFPYVNPGLEVDISNPFKKNAWLEVGGAGLVHPEVIKNFGLDPAQYQGLAFGFGIDRMAQLKLNLSGLSQFFESDIEFLKGRE
jgi:phenylalanyl-tRNA synthetase alpha chain